MTLNVGWVRGTVVLRKRMLVLMKNTGSIAIIQATTKWSTVSGEAFKHAGIRIAQLHLDSGPSSLVRRLRQVLFWPQ